MSQFRAVGSYVQLLFRTKFPTFTPDQFVKALKDRKYSSVQGQVSNPQNPQAPPIAVTLFSKGNINIYLIPNLNQVVLQILNTVNLQSAYEEISKILFELNIIKDIVSDIVFNCTTKAPTKIEPKKNLTSLVNTDFLQGIAKEFKEDLGVVSIRLATTFPLERDGLQVILEPLGTSPKSDYYLNIIYRTSDMDKFDAFVRNFGDSVIQGIIGEAEKNV